MSNNEPNFIDVEIEFFSDMDVGSDELTWIVGIVFIVVRHLDLYELIDTIYFSKIPCESFGLIETLDWVFEILSKESTGTVKYISIQKSLSVP